MSDAPIVIANAPGASAVLRVPWSGLWVFDGTVNEDVDLAGRIQIKLGALVLSGTVEADSSGHFRSGTSVRVYAGADGWRKVVDKKPWHADNGVSRNDVIRTTAASVGEIVSFDVPDVVVGVDFSRRRGVASSVFEQTGVKAWWVDYLGTTHVADDRPVRPTGTVELLSFDPSTRIAVFGDIAPIEIGSVITIDGASHVVRELRFEVMDDGSEAVFRTVACVANVTVNRLYDAIAAIVRQVNAERLYGAYKYRVYKMNVDRVNLQAVTTAPGLPDVLPAQMWNGIAGAWSKLAPGTIVLVEFVEGDVTQPRVTHFSPKGGAAWIPVETLIDASDKIRIGPSAQHVEFAGGGPGLHRIGDFGDAGSLTGAGATGLQYSGPNGGSGTITATADLSTGTVSFAGSATLKTEAKTGSSKANSG